MATRMIVDERSLEQWLQGRARAETIVLATRAAGRVAPLWARAIEGEFAKFAELQPLTHWRGLLTSAVAAVAADQEVIVAAVSAHDIATDERRRARAANRDLEFDMFCRSGMNIDDYAAASRTYHGAWKRESLAREAGNLVEAAAAAAEKEAAIKILNYIHGFHHPLGQDGLDPPALRARLDLAIAEGCARSAVYEAIQSAISGVSSPASRYPHVVEPSAAKPAARCVQDGPSALFFAVRAAVGQRGGDHQRILLRAREEGEAQAAGLWAQTREDADMLLHGDDLFAVPLWTLPEPEWFRVTEADGRAVPARSPSVWGFWRRWWDGLRSGQPLDWTLQRQVALIPEDIWKQGPEAVASLIADIERVV